MKESETTEFKKSLAELGDGLNSVAAILNKHGAGELWFGIKNDGNPAGMDVSETTLRKVSQAIAAHIEPKIYPEVSTVALGGKSCIRVAFSGGEKPYYAHGRAYMRVADEDRQLSAKEIESIILRKNRSHQGWDSEPILELSTQCPLLPSRRDLHHRVPQTVCQRRCRVADRFRGPVTAPVTARVTARVKLGFTDSQQLGQAAFGKN